MRTTRSASSAAALALAIALCAACSKGTDSTPAPAAFEYAGTYETEYRPGGGAWSVSDDLRVTAAGEVYWGATQILNPTVGTDTVSWSMADGNGSEAAVEFADSSTSELYWGAGGHTGRLLEGTIQSPGEGGCDWRGVLIPACGTSAECAAQAAHGQVCVGGLCRECGADADCSAGFVCRQSKCVPKPQCQADADCAKGQVCEAGKCVAPPKPLRGEE